MRRVLIGCVACLIILSGCSGDDDPVQDQAAQDAADQDQADQVVTDASDDDQASAESGSQAPTSTEAVVISDEPAVRVPANEGPIDGSNWLARTSMDSGSVELVWSPVDNAKTYRLYRLPTAEANYDAIATGDLNGAEEIFEGSEYGYIDTDVPAGEFLTYAVVAELDDGRTEPRWTEALTIDDVTPPTPVENLSAEVTADGILLQWSPSSDDVEFAAYNVSLLAADGTRQYLGGGADEGQTSFLDTDPIDGLNRYVVIAVDFHNNMSEPAQVEIDA